VNWGGVRLVTLVKLSITADLIEVLLIIDGSADHFARIGDGAPESQPRDRQLWTRSRYGSSTLYHSIEIGNEYVVGRQRVPVYRQDIKSRRHIPHIGIFDETDTAIAKTAKPHFSLIPASFIHQLREKGICGYLGFREVFFVGLPDELMLVTNGPPRIDHDESAFSMQLGVFLHHLWSKL